MSSNFVFLNENPVQHDDATFRRKVRSQAATYSHRIAPRRGSKSARYQPRQYAPLSTASSSSVPQALPGSTSTSSDSVDGGLADYSQPNPTAKPSHSHIHDAEVLHRPQTVRSPPQCQLQKALWRPPSPARFKLSPPRVRKSPVQPFRKRPRTPIAANVSVPMLPSTRNYISIFAIRSAVNEHEVYPLVAHRPWLRTNGCRIPSIWMPAKKIPSTRTQCLTKSGLAGC